MPAHPAGPRHAEVLHEPGLPPLPDDLGALAPGVWSDGVRRDADGSLRLRGTPLRDLAAAHGTPAYVLDEGDVRDRMRAWRAAFGDADVYYAGKAFLSVAMARWVSEEDLGLDVCTGGELAVALRAGFDPARITMHGNNKSTAELARAIEVGVGRIVVDSFDEIDRLAALTTGAAQATRVLIRATVGVEAHTHEFVATAHEDQKFGFSLASGAAEAAVERVLAVPGLELLGIHSHIGSQIFDTSGFEVSAHRVLDLLAGIRDAHGIELPEIDLGGGLGIAYLSGDDPMTPADIAPRLRVIVERESANHGLRPPRLTVEPGRAIVGPGVLTLYEVGTVKELDVAAGLRRTYVSVDGGMSDNIRTALYDAAYTCVLADRTSDAPPQLSRVVGKHCESGDVVVRDAWLPADVRPGDLLAVAATGAYCRSMASNYNHLPRPPVVSVARDGSDRVLVRRETEDDLLATDLG
jgi:diaminopimelate decarboxylase